MKRLLLFLNNYIFFEQLGHIFNGKDLRDNVKKHVVFI